MRWLADHCVYRSTIELLNSLEHDVVTLQQLGMADAGDRTVIEEAVRNNRILLTRDKDFANIIAYPPEHYHGIVVLRMKANDEHQVHSVFIDFIKGKDTNSIDGKLAIVSKDKVRIR